MALLPLPKGSEFLRLLNFMKILCNSTPAKDGFYMPAEFEPHKGCILIFPERSDSWQYGGYAARKAFGKIVEAIARSEQVTVCASAKQYNNARSILPPQVRIVEMSSNDSWARDYAPTFVCNGQGEVRGVDWGFNAWGGLYDGLYFPWDKDNEMARKICDLFQFDVYHKREFILEGGSIHVDGEGTCIVTEACLLSKGRNPSLTKEEIEENLRQYLGVTTIIWLPCGIYQDETNEHVDNICAFTTPGEVVLAWTEDKEDIQYKMSKACLEVLSKVVDAKGRKLKIHKLPLPKPVILTKEECEGLDWYNGNPARIPGERLAASYVNFYIANENIILPAFCDPADQQAKEIIQGLFPDREVIQIDTRDILIGGGNIHCITQQIPIGIKKKSE